MVEKRKIGTWDNIVPTVLSIEILKANVEKLELTSKGDFPKTKNDELNKYARSGCTNTNWASL